MDSETNTRLQVFCLTWDGLIIANLNFSCNENAWFLGCVSLPKKIIALEGPRIKGFTTMISI